MVYSWSAKFIDSSSINQFLDNQEILFKTVLDRETELKYFSISDNTRKIGINLLTGVFNIDGVSISFDKISNRQLEYRLIFFRRVRRDFAIDNLSGVERVNYHIGFQVTIDEKNYQRILVVNEATQECSLIEKGVVD